MTDSLAGYRQVPNLLWMDLNHDYVFSEIRGRR